MSLGCCDVENVSEIVVTSFLDSVHLAHHTGSNLLTLSRGLHVARTMQHVTCHAKRRPSVLIRARRRGADDVRRRHSKSKKSRSTLKGPGGQQLPSHDPHVSRESKTKHTVRQVNKVRGSSRGVILRRWII